MYQKSISENIYQMMVDWDYTNTHINSSPDPKVKHHPSELSSQSYFKNIQLFPEPKTVYNQQPSAAL